MHQRESVRGANTGIRYVLKGGGIIGQDCAEQGRGICATPFRLGIAHGILVSYLWLRETARWLTSLLYPPASTKLKGGYTGITLSVCPSVDRIVSALYLQQYSSDPFHICTSYQATSEGVSHVMPVSKFKNLQFWRFFKICSFAFVFFWHCHCRLQFRMDYFHIWYKWSIAWEGVSHVMTFDLDLYLQGHSALT